MKGRREKGTGGVSDGRDVLGVGVDLGDGVVAEDADLDDALEEGELMEILGVHRLTGLVVDGASYKRKGFERKAG